MIAECLEWEARISSRAMVRTVSRYHWAPGWCFPWYTSLSILLKIWLRPLQLCDCYGILGQLYLDWVGSICNRVQRSLDKGWSHLHSSNIRYLPNLSTHPPVLPSGLVSWWGLRKNRQSRGGSGARLCRWVERVEGVHWLLFLGRSLRGKFLF